MGTLNILVHFDYARDQSLEMLTGYSLLQILGYSDAYQNSNLHVRYDAQCQFIFMVNIEKELPVAVSLNIANLHAVNTFFFVFEVTVWHTRRHCKS